MSERIRQVAGAVVVVALALTVGLTASGDAFAGKKKKGKGATGSCTNTNTGAIILDMTSTVSTIALQGNLSIKAGCGKSATTIGGGGVGGNALNITNFHTLLRDSTVSPHALRLVIGLDPSIVSDGNFGTKGQLNYFASGHHLFELNRLRSTADWLSEDKDGDQQPDHIAPDAGVPYGSYGTITMEQFLRNIAANRTMYGVVRVLVPLEKGTSGSAVNALGQAVTPGSLYGFCKSNVGLCSCAPGSSFTKIREGQTICGITLPANAQIRVKGALFWDFVDGQTHVPVPLAELPFDPRELYFKVEVPILVNWANDQDGDGALDNIFAIKAVSWGKSAGQINPVIAYSDVPREARDSYRYATGRVLTAGEFAALNKPTQYHLLMASGYAEGWAEAFDKLNITAKQWEALPPASCVTELGHACAKFSVPPVSGVMAADDIRDDRFEDIPAYLYSGGLIDMHDHVNISGLVYVPQAMELEAKDSKAPTRQYIIGSVLVRDGFYIEAKDNTVTVLSSDPTSYASAVTSEIAARSSTAVMVANGGIVDSAGTGVTGSSGTTGTGTDPGTLCLGCLGGTPAASNTSGASLAPSRWQIVVPR